MYNNGIKISKIAAIESEEMKAMALSKLQEENGNEFYIKELIEASINLDEERFERTFEEVLKKKGTEDTILKIINPFQERIGVLWLTDHIIPAQEHFTSNIIKQKLTVAINDLPFVKNSEKKEILLFTPRHEQHEIPLQFVHYLLKKNQNKVVYFGCDTSLRSIEYYAKNRSFNYLYFHLVTNLTNISPDQYLEKVSKSFPDKQIIMSGMQVQQVTKTPKNVRLLKSINEMMEFTYE